MPLCARSPAKRATRGRRVVWALAMLCAASTATAQTTAPDAVDLTIPQARQVAVQALSKGQPDVAAQIALGLLQRDGHDAFAHFVLARALQQMQQPDKGRSAAARAYRHAQTPTQRYEASQLAATLAYETGAHGVAQLWLRRSWNHAPSPKARAVLKRDYAVLRRLNPWRVQGRFSIVPSDNVNNGAKDPFALIEGVPIVGLLSGSALALPGTMAVGDVTAGYRLRQSKHSQTLLTGRLYLSRVALSDEAQRIAPAAQNQDFAYTDATIGLEHQVARNSGGQISYAMMLGRTWYAGAPYQDKISMGVSHQSAQKDTGHRRISARIERARPLSGQADLYQLDLSAQWSHPRPNGDSWGYGLAAKLVETRTDIHRERRATGHVSYGFGKPWGPAKVALTIGASVGHYPDYHLGPIVVPGGRDDRSVFANARFTFENLDYAGFAPTMTLQAQRSDSNVSRFTSDAISVSLGFVSRF